MSIPPPPYLLEYRAARALMAQGNIGPATLQNMLDNGDCFFFDGDAADFDKCPLCQIFLSSHKNCFLKVTGDDLQIQGAVAAKLVEKGKLAPARRQLAEPTLKMIGIASREGLTCVVEPQKVLWDNIGAFTMAAISVISLQDFIAAL